MDKEIKPMSAMLGKPPVSTPNDELPTKVAQKMYELADINAVSAGWNGETEQCRKQFIEAAKDVIKLAKSHSIGQYVKQTAVQNKPLIMQILQNHYCEIQDKDGHLTEASANLLATDILAAYWIKTKFWKSEPPPATESKN